MYPSQKTLERVVEENYRKLKHGILIDATQKFNDHAHKAVQPSNRYFNDGKSLLYFSRWLGNFPFTRNTDGKLTILIFGFFYRSF